MLKISAQASTTDFKTAVSFRIYIKDFFKAKMKTPLNISKISPPRLPRILDRSRLIQILEENQDKSLILITGQAAQGKSTLAASYAQKSETPWAWMNLEIEESDPVNLFYLLVQSLQHALNEVDLSPIQDYPAQVMGPREEIPLYREWTNAILDRIPVPIKIFLDGLDRLAPDAPSYGFLKILLDEAPPDITFIMLSRAEPPLEIQSLKISRKAAIIDNKDLSFTEDEIKTFFREIRRMPFTKPQWKKIHQLTEGWVGGLVLLSETLNRLSGASRDQYISKYLPEQFKVEVFQYFGEEIFSSLPDMMQEFLVKSSIFDMIEPGFMKNFIGTENAENILQDLEKKNLFVQSVYDNQKGWMFKYHQLFKDFLKSKFELQIDKKGKSSLFLKAGSLFKQKGDFEESVKFFLKAKAYPEASSIIRLIGMDFLKSGRTGHLEQLLQKLPENLVQEDPWLLLYLIMARRYTSAERNIRSIQKALSLFQYQEDVRGQILSLAFMIEASCIKGRDYIPMAILLEQGETLLQSLNPDQYPYERAILWFQMGLGFILRGNQRKGIAACENAYLISKRLGDLQLQAYSQCYTVMALCWLGEFALAEDFFENMRGLIDKLPYPELRCLYQIHYGMICICKVDLEKTDHWIHLAQAGIKEHGLIYMYPLALLYDLVSKSYLGEHEKAQEIADRLMGLALSLDNLFLQGVTLLYLGISFFRKRNFQKSKKLIAHSREILSSDEARCDTYLHVIKIMMSKLSYHLKEHGSEERELYEAIDYFRHVSSYAYLMEAHFVMSLMKYRQGNVAEAAAHLLEGFRIAEQRGYYIIWNVDRNDFVNLCTLAIEMEVKEAMDYATLLLSTSLADQAGSAIEQLSKHSKPRIRKKAKEIRQVIHRAGLPRIRIKTLGNFNVLKNDVPIEDKKWQGNQPKRLLKAIIARGSLKVSKEIIMEDLWPESQPEPVENKFKVTLHRLRKVLEPKTDKTIGYTYIQLKDKFISLDKDLCYADADEFLSLYDKGKIKGKSGDETEALSFYEAAAKLYQGDFLKEDLYESWTYIKREELRIKYIDLLYKTAQLYESRGGANKAIACYKKVIQSDPASENAYRRLMTLYSNRGMRSAALKTYEECKRALQTGLDTVPDEVTTSIYKKVLES
jgi:LuxR family maltose regulon positive regulatory protein